MMYRSSSENCVEAPVHWRQILPVVDELLRSSYHDTPYVRRSIDGYNE